MNPSLWINRENLVKNIHLIKQKTTSPFVCPMVKANAYGVGDSLVVQTLLNAGIKHFGVARTFEGEKIRRFFPTLDFEILVFNSFSLNNIDDYLKSDLTPVVTDQSSLNAIKDLGVEQRKRLRDIHIKFDLGMSRFGFRPEESQNLKEQLHQLGLKVGGVCGHFSKSEDFGQEGGQSKIKLKELIASAQTIGVSVDKVHAANSAAIEWGQSFEVGLRPGIGMYGIGQKKGSGLEGVLSLKAPLVGVNSVLEGETVSYGGTWVAKKDCKIGILPIGYADGLRRGLSNRIKFQIDGVECDQVGLICMDYSMVDLSPLEGAQVGEEVILFNENYSSLYEWADLLGTIPYELISGLGDRVERKAF
jgi:alanine racemase